MNQADTTAILDSSRAMTGGLAAPGLYLSPIAQSCAARERAWRAGDATTLNLLGLFLSATMQRRRKTRLARHRLARPIASAESNAQRSMPPLAVGLGEIEPAGASGRVPSAVAALPVKIYKRVAVPSSAPGCVGNVTVLVAPESQGGS